MSTAPASRTCHHGKKKLAVPTAQQKGQKSKNTSEEVATEHFQRGLDNFPIFSLEIMPMGVSAAPSIFGYWVHHLLDKLPKAIRKHVTNFQDDVVITGESFTQCRQNISVVRKLLREHKVKVNPSKSVMTPTRVIDALGYEVSDTVNIKDERKDRVIQKIQFYRNLNILTKRQRARIVSQILYCSMRDPKVREVLQPFYYEMNRLEEWTSSKALTNVEIETLDKMKQWLEQGGAIEVMPSLYTDATDYHLAAQFRGRSHLWRNRVQPHMSAVERELRAILQAIPVLKLPDQVRILSDSQAGITAINKRFSKNRIINTLVKQINNRKKMARARWIFQFVQGSKNLADIVSRNNQAEAVENAAYKEAYREEGANIANQRCNKVTE